MLLFDIQKFLLHLYVILYSIHIMIKINMYILLSIPTCTWSQTVFVLYYNIILSSNNKYFTTVQSEFSFVDF